MSTTRLAMRPLLIGAGLTACVLFAPGARGQDPSPIIAQVKAALKEPNKPFTLIVSLQARENAGAKLEAAVAKAAVSTRKEKGCLAYDLNRDAKNPTQYVLYERWSDLAALEAHLKTDYITALLGELGELTGSSEIRVLIPTGSDAGPGK